MHHITPSQLAYCNAAAKDLKKTRAGATRALFWSFFAQAPREAYTAQNFKASWRGRAAIIYYKRNGDKREGKGGEGKGTGGVERVEKIAA